MSIVHKIKVILELPKIQWSVKERLTEIRAVQVNLFYQGTWHADFNPINHAKDNRSFSLDTNITKFIL